jgi:hypothetical protein
MTATRWRAGMALAMAVVVAWAGIRAPQLAVVPPRGGMLPVNAAIVVKGHSYGFNPVVEYDGARLPVRYESWPAIGNDGVWLVRPASGDWPAGAELRLREPGANLGALVRTSKERDTGGPELDVTGGAHFGPARKLSYQREIPGIGPDRWPRVDVVRVPHPVVREAHSPLVKIELIWEGPDGRGAAAGSVVPGQKGELETGSLSLCTATSKTSGRIIDTAGNTTPIGPAACSK